MTIAEMILLGAGDGKCVSVLGDKYTFKAAHKDTGGAYALWEIAPPATAAGPPAHVHERGDEAFYVLEGELTFQIGERTVHAIVGPFALAPRGDQPPDMEKLLAIAARYGLKIVGPQ